MNSISNGIRWDIILKKQCLNLTHDVKIFLLLNLTGITQTVIETCLVLLDKSAKKS